jgi:hypothetical protein
MSNRVYLVELKGKDESGNQVVIEHLGIFAKLEDAQNSVSRFNHELNDWEDCDEWSAKYDVPVWNIETGMGPKAWPLNHDGRSMDVDDVIDGEVIIDDKPLIYACRMHSTMIDELEHVDKDFPGLVDTYTDVYAIIQAFTVQ